LGIGVWDYVENNPDYPPSPLVASGPEEPLARRGGGEGEYAMSTPTSILPHQGEDKTWQFSCFVGGHAARTNYVENNPPLPFWEGIQRRGN